MIDVDGLLAAVLDDSPCGEDLAYDPAYIELESIAQGKPEQVMGDQVIAAEEPNWREVRDRCVELCKRTKDLRVTLYLTAAILQLEGLAGLRDGLKLLRGMLDQYWENVYPQLDPDDQNDPTERVNIIDALARPPYTAGDPMKFQQRLREVHLCHSKQLGQYSLRDIAVASGEIKPAAGEAAPPSMSGVEAAFMDTDVERLQTDADAVAQAIDEVKAIENGLTDRIGADRAPNLNSFLTVLQHIQKIQTQYLAKRGLGAPQGQEVVEEGGSVAEGEPGAAPAATAAAAAPAVSGEIRSREDVIRVLDKAIDYYRRQEPSSPVPLLLGRAKRLVVMNFMDIIQDLTPEAIKQIQLIGGVDNASEGG